MRSGWFLLLAAFISCTSIPDGIEAVSPFDAKRYMGKWYEVARLENRFEKNLDNTTAEYTLNADGRITVVNRGRNIITGAWEEAKGKAKFAGDENTGSLKVSFFGPFYAGYHVIALDDNYQYALVAGDKLKYLWILSRTKTIPEEIQRQYLDLAASKGFEVSELIWEGQE